MGSAIARLTLAALASLVQTRALRYRLAALLTFLVGASQGPPACTIPPTSPAGLACRGPFAGPSPGICRAGIRRAGEVAGLLRRSV
jgi:hypothetical protein